MTSGTGALFSSALETALFLAAVLLWLLTELVLGAVVTIRRRRNKAGMKAARDRFSGLAVRFMLYLSIIIAFGLALNGITIAPDWLFYAGVLLTIAGVLVRQWALFALGHYFTPVIAVQPGQHVVDSGPYRLVRHPSYLGILLTAVGIGSMLRSMAGALVIVALCGLAVGYRIWIEERFLVSELGDEYVRYVKRTKRLVPFLL
jgi:protein-S-isoprenylcysteine O-methyltransferase Ste14